MKPDLHVRNIGRRVRAVLEPKAVGVVTVDLRHENQQPPLAHVSLYVRWEAGLYQFGTWFGACGEPLEWIEEVT